MADVRSLLRAERANWRITHPNATYTSGGKLHCNLCESVVKSEAAWQAHLHSTGHTLRVSRQEDAAAVRGTGEEAAGVGKKRKAASLDSLSPVDERKRVKGAAAEGEQREADVEEELRNDTPNALPQEPAATSGTSQPLPPPPTATDDSVDESELAAFERELAELENTAPPSTSAFNAGAFISAAPMTAEELAAQAREEQSAQRGKRDAEIEEEREEAEETLREELEEMERYEERVRKLRERREALRKGSMENGDQGHAAAAMAVEPALNGDGAVGEDDGDDEDEEEYNDWGFGGR